MGLFDKFKRGLSKTKELLRTDVRDLFKAGEVLDEEKLADFEARLLKTDMGVSATEAIISDLREKHGGRTVIVDEIWSTFKESLTQQLHLGDQANPTWDINDPLSPLSTASDGPTVLLVAGVNGVGKTTSIAKLANLIMKAGNSVVLAAGDTFRAGAVHQLKLWSERLGCEIITRPEGSDPASVAFAGCQRALEANADFLIVDTAGRLQTHLNLMKELAKIYQVIGQKVPDAPHESLLVLDATTGQNGISQATKFSDSVQCTGIVLAKLDGSAKGGIVVPIRQQMGIPVKYVGVGEQIDDLEVFDSAMFVEALFRD